MRERGRVQLRGGGIVIDLDQYSRQSIRLLRGASGFGMPRVATHWFEGAGDGARFDGERVLPRDLDLPLWVPGGSPEPLRQLVHVLAAGPDLVFTDVDGEAWSCQTRRTGGGDWRWGRDTDGRRGLQTVVTLRAGDPFWVRERAASFEVAPSIAPEAFLDNLAALPVASSQAFGTRTMVNPGTAPSEPVWIITGPGDHFKTVSPTGEVLEWNGTLAAGQTLTINTRLGTAVDQDGVSQYASFTHPARFWKVPPGTHEVEVLFENVTPGVSRIQAFWQPRSWVVW